MTLDLAGILDRVERMLDAKGLKADAASRLAGKPDAIRNLRRAVRNGKRTGVTTATIAALAPVLGTTPGWLIDGYQTEIRSVPLGEEFDPDPEFVEDPERVDAARRFERRRLAPGEVVERNVTAGLGIGGDATTIYADGQVVDEVRAVWRLPVDYLHTELSARESEVDFITVSGDSMISTLLPGDKVLVNRALNSAGDGVYVIHDGIGPSVKRLEVDIGSSPLRIRILADNPAHGAREILASDLVVIGKVIMRASRL
jgi:hypothetical protein